MKVTTILQYLGYERTKSKIHFFIPSSPKISAALLAVLFSSPYKTYEPPKQPEMDGRCILRRYLVSRLPERSGIAYISKR